MGELEKLAELIESGKAQNIIVLSGAGISTGAGIPDFRTPGTGLYDNLQKYNLPYPEAIFEIDYYRKKPDAFVSLAHEMWPGIRYQPTLTHYFLKALADKGLLLRIYSQNIDGLEFLAGIPDEKLVECHGHFRTASCIDCGATAEAKQVKDTIVRDGRTPKCRHCGGNVKPDIVFFGEGLPSRFHRLLKQDISKADLLLVMGTSLKVAPVSMIPDMVQCGRILFNRDLVMKIRKDRDMFVSGECDDNIQKLIDLLGWTMDTNKISGDINRENLSDSNQEEKIEEQFAKIQINNDGEENQGDQSCDARDNSEVDEENDNFEPTTVVIMLGSMNFEPVTSIDILSLKIENPDERSEVLAKASEKIKPNSLESVHVLIKSSSVSTLFHESILSTLVEGIIPGKEVTVHVLPETDALAEDMAVQDGDVDSVRMGLVMAGLQLKVEQEQRGAWILTATKSDGMVESNDDED